MSQPQKQDCHTLQRVDLARPFLVSPAIKIEIEYSLEIALSEAKSGSAWQSHFWGCDMTLRTPPAPSKDDTNIHVLNWGGPPLGVQNLYTFPTLDSARKRKMRKMLF